MILQSILTAVQSQSGNNLRISFLKWVTRLIEPLQKTLQALKKWN